MATANRATLDGNEAVASVAYRANEVIAIYPITPASTMGELADAWAASGRTNLWGQVPTVVELQSEGGAAGACHGALQAGSLTTTFTASQGLLLMLPNLYKIAGELTPFCLHVAARTVATHALSIFGDHSDVMAARQTGVAMLASGSVQEAQDLACIAHAATLASRVPFLHFFDGFRTSHEVSKIETISDEQLAEMISDEHVRAHRSRALDPERPVLRGTAQNPDAFFQAREAANPFYDACPTAVRDAMTQFERITGRSYHLVDYFGSPEAERVVVLMGSGSETVREVVETLVANGEPVGVLVVRLYRPFPIEDFIAALPASTRGVAVLDRTKEPGAVGEPLWLDVVAALEEARATGAVNVAFRPCVIGGRYGLSSKEFDPPMVRAVFEELRAESPRRRFTVGIVDDVTHLSLPIDRNGERADGRVQSAVFWGLGSDGTVGANKNTIKIIGENTDLHVQGYFVYDSKKAGAVTVSHLRFGPAPIRSAYLVHEADFVACHQFELLERLDVLGRAAEESTFLLNAPYGPDEVWDRLPREVQETLLEKRITMYVIDAHQVAKETGLRGRINTIMQTCFFSIFGLLPKGEAIEHIKESIRKTYERRGSVIVERNFQAVDRARGSLHRVAVPKVATSTRRRSEPVPPEAPDFVQRITASLLAGRGDALPVSAFPPDGTWPTGTAKWEKRNLATEIPIWDADLCIQCNRCALACPHAAIRAKRYDADNLHEAPAGFPSADWRAPGSKTLVYTLQVAPEDCTGCSLCFEVCPVKDKATPRRRAINMKPRLGHLDREREYFDFFLDLPETKRSEIEHVDARESQLLEPLFEFSGACAGCGETPYLKLLTQLFGDRLLVANATGCSSIFGGNLPTTPWTTNREGRGPAWSNSLFEDNAEFGYGFRLSVDARHDLARTLVGRLRSTIGERLADELLGAQQIDDGAIGEQRDRVRALREVLRDRTEPECVDLVAVADMLVKRSVWIVGGDGWAYDIGYGGLDHVLSQHRNVNVLVLDTEVYSNTGGQQSKATPMGAVAKFAAAGKDSSKKDLALEAMSYGHVYVARVAFGANMNQTVSAIAEADAYDGPALVLAYSHCIAHGYDLRNGAEQQKLASLSGAWPLFRYDPTRVRAGQPPLHLDSRPPKISLARYWENEARFRMVETVDPTRHRKLLDRASREVARRWEVYRQLSELVIPSDESTTQAPASAPSQGG